MHLHTLRPTPGSKKRRKRIGRGTGSGHGTFATRGCKGQLARAGGGGKGPQFEGGQVPLVRRQPKLGGFRNPNREEYEIINLSDLEETLEAGSYDIDALRSKELLKRKLPVKILGMGQVTKKFILIVDSASQSAKKAIEKAGGTITILHG